MGGGQPITVAEPVLIQDFSDIDPKGANVIGTFQDNLGSNITLEKKGKGSKAERVLDYTLKEGGWCGIWCRAGGADWAGADLSPAKDIRLSVYCKSSVVLGLALKDKNNNQYTADKKRGQATINHSLVVHNGEPD
jgi:hypothetical protein